MKVWCVAQLTQFCGCKLPVCLDFDFCCWEFWHSNCVSRSTYQTRTFSCSAYLFMVGKKTRSQWEVKSSTQCEDAKIWKIFSHFSHDFSISRYNQVNNQTRVKLSGEFFIFPLFLWLNCVVRTMRAYNKWNSRILRYFEFEFHFISWPKASKSHILRWKIYSHVRWKLYMRNFDQVLCFFFNNKKICVFSLDFWMIQMSTWWPSQRWVRLTPATKSTHRLLPPYVRSLIRSAGKGRTFQRPTMTGTISMTGECTAHTWKF